MFTRRDPAAVKTDDPNVRVFHVDDAVKYTDKIDVMILCGGSSSDLPKQGPEFLKLFNTVDSFDTHAKIPEYFETMDAVAKSSKNWNYFCRMGSRAFFNEQDADRSDTA